MRAASEATLNAEQRRIANQAIERKELRLYLIQRGLHIPALHLADRSPQCAAILAITCLWPAVQSVTKRPQDLRLRIYPFCSGFSRGIALNCAPAKRISPETYAQNNSPTETKNGP